MCLGPPWDLKGALPLSIAHTMLCWRVGTVGHTPSLMLPLFPKIFPSSCLRVGSLPLPHGLLPSLLVPVAFGGAAESSHICSTSLSVLGSDPFAPPMGCQPGQLSPQLPKSV